MAGMTRSLCAAGGALAVASIVAACGGGSSRDTFTPARLIVFGDESSVICDGSDTQCAAGRKYTVNALKTDATTGAVSDDCASNPIWVQTLASAYHLVFAECKSDPASATTALMHAKAGATAAQLVTQVDSHLLNDAFTGTDLVTVLVGENDIVEQYNAYPGQSEDELKATLATRGAAVAAQVNRIAEAGGKVLAVTVPDLSLTPFALTEKNNHADVDRQALLQRLTTAFNTALRLNLINDGHKIGLVLEDELLQSDVAAGTALFANTQQAACDPALAALLPQCTTSTLVSGASATTWLWANDKQLSPGGHARLGSAALGRAQNNPF